MLNDNEAQAALATRISDLRRRIAVAEERPEQDGKPWDGSVGLQILDLLKSTLKDLEARLAALQDTNKK